MAILVALIVNIGVLFFNLKNELDKHVPKMKWILVAGI